MFLNPINWPQRMPNPVEYICNYLQLVQNPSKHSNHKPVRPSQKPPKPPMAYKRVPKSKYSFQDQPKPFRNGSVPRAMHPSPASSAYNFQSKPATRCPYQDQYSTPGKINSAAQVRALSHSRQGAVHRKVIEDREQKDRGSLGRNYVDRLSRGKGG